MSVLPSAPTVDAPANRSVSRTIGVVISVLVGTFLVFDAAGKQLVLPEGVKEGTEALGFPVGQALIMGIVLSVRRPGCAHPRTPSGGFGAMSTLPAALVTSVHQFR